MRALGVRVYEADTETLSVFGAGLRGLKPPRRPIDCGNAGTLMRLLPGILAGQAGRFTVTGDESLSSRPMERIAEPLRRMGVAIETTDGHAPLTIEGGDVQPISYELPGRERAGEVGRPARRALRARRRDDRRRAAADPRPHRDDARGRGREDPAPAEERVRLAGRAARAGHGRGAGRLLVRGAAHRRDDAPRRLRADRARRQPEPTADRPPRRARADGRRASPSSTAGGSAARPAATSTSARPSSSAPR